MKSVNIENDERQLATVYSYNKPESPRTSSGVSSFEPYNLNIMPTGVGGFIESNLKAYKKALLKYSEELLSISRILPSPGPVYEFVTVSNEIRDPIHTSSKVVPGKSIYQFEVFNPLMVNKKLLSSYEANVNSSNVYDHLRNITIRNSASRIGLLKRVAQYDAGNKKLTETVNHYLHDNLNETASSFYESYENRLGEEVGGRNYNKQGLFKERFGEAKNRYTDDGKTHQHMTMSMWEEYPVVSTGSTTFNYVNGTATSVENLAFDFYSGSITKTVSVDANGNRSMTEIIPAYHKYPEMKMKVGNYKNKNMLAQVAANYLHGVDNNNSKVGIISASVNTWSKDINVVSPSHDIIKQNSSPYGTYLPYVVESVWRPRMTYTWSPEGTSQNGITAIGLFTDFNWASQHTPAAQNAGWIKTGEITLYDVYSHALEDVTSFHFPYLLQLSKRL